MSDHRNVSFVTFDWFWATKNPASGRVVGEGKNQSGSQTPGDINVTGHAANQACPRSENP